MIFFGIDIEIPKFINYRIVSMPIKQLSFKKSNINKRLGNCYANLHRTSRYPKKRRHYDSGLGDIFTIKNFAWPNPYFDRFTSIFSEKIGQEGFKKGRSTVSVKIEIIIVFITKISKPGQKCLKRTFFGN